jgi:hypothetical protein
MIRMAAERQGPAANIDQVKNPRARAADEAMHVKEPAQNPSITPRLIPVVIAVLIGVAILVALFALPR